MGQEKRFDPLWVKAPCLPIHPFHAAAALEEAAVYQGFLAGRCLKQITGTGYGSGPAQTAYSDHATLLSWRIEFSLVAFMQKAKMFCRS
jgi:hypothetical protein